MFEPETWEKGKVRSRLNARIGVLRGGPLSDAKGHFSQDGRHGRSNKRNCLTEAHIAQVGRPEEGMQYRIYILSTQK